ncbi:MAG: 23S rRNA (guanosine(2251)-2'-O)-methyltransferase RlmB [Bacteroidetes bacterium]|nr:23S rRNA (guanosine(2251)-2'-O)-methyltransferase RlmB [Bacteroidota bacterium]
MNEKRLTRPTMIIVGRKPVLEALRANVHIKKLILLRTSTSKLMSDFRSLASARGIPVSEVNHDEFYAFIGNESKRAQGVAIVVEAFHYATVDAILQRARERDEKPFILVLDEIEDPQNLGALIRTAECAGAHGVVIPKHHAASVTPTVVKASAGASAHILIARVTNIVQTLEELKKYGVWIVGTAVESQTLYTAIDYSEAVALIIGNEGRGMRRLVREHCDFVVRIPVFGRVQSLNASVAGALLLYEVVRSRHRATRTENDPQIHSFL